MGGVAGAGGQVAEEGLVVGVGPQVADPADGVVDQILGEVVALLRGAGRRHLVVVGDEVGVVLVGLAGQEPVEPLEPFRQGPAVAGPAQRHLRGRGQVPLAEGEGGVAVADQDLRQEPVVGLDVGVVAGEAGGELDDAGHARGVVVAAGEQAGPGGGAQGGGVVVGVAQPAGGQTVEGGGGDVGPVAAELGVAHVVQQHQHDVGCPVGGPLQRRPGGGGIGERAPDGAGEILTPAHGSPWTSRFGRSLGPVAW